jgi:hypothetical protein
LKNKRLQKFDAQVEPQVPLFAYMIKSLSLLILGTAIANAELRVVTDFEGGNAEVVMLDQTAAKLRIMPALHEGRGWPCWWFLRLEGTTAGQKITLEVQGQTRPFRPDTVLASSWCQPDQAVLSHDGKIWHQTTKAERTADKVAVYQVQAEGPSLWLAWGPPFVPATAESVLAGVKAKLGDEAERFELAKTRDGRPVSGIRIGKPNAPRQVWVNARQHAWEAGGAWVGRGFVEWLASAEAQDFRKRCCVHFIPIMDVDNVTLGAGGKESLPQDHNRDWSDAPYHPEVTAAQKRISEIQATHGLDVFLDLHNPGPTDRAPYFFGPFGFERMTGLQRENYQRWMDLAAAHLTGPLKVEPKYRYATYVKTEEERGRMSSGWARAHGGEGTISITLETAWNTPNSTAENYMTVGGQLARALDAYLKEPRH